MGSVRPHRWQPTRLPHPWDSPSKNTGGGCHFLLQCMKGKSESEVAQSCPTLSDPMDCSPPGSSIHGIFQARVLEWGAIAFSVKGYICNNILCSSAGTKAPLQKEDGNFKLSTRFQGHCPVTSPPITQKKVTQQAALTPNFVYNTPPPETTWEFRSFEHRPPVALIGPATNLSLLQTLMFQFV